MLSYSARQRRVVRLGLHARTAASMRAKRRRGFGLGPMAEPRRGRLDDVAGFLRPLDCAAAEPFELLEASDGDGPEPMRVDAASPRAAAHQACSAPHAADGAACVSANGGHAQRWPALPFALPGDAAPRDAPESVYLPAAAQPLRAARSAAADAGGNCHAATRAGAEGDGASARAGERALADRPLGTALAERALKEALLLLATEAG